EEQLALVLGARTNESEKKIITPKIIGRIFRPYTSVALTIAKRINEDRFEKIVSPTVQTKEVLVREKTGQITVSQPIQFEKSADLVVKDQSVVENLNAELVGGRTPGQEPGNLVYLDENGGISLSGGIFAASLGIGGEGTIGSLIVSNFSCVACIGPGEVDFSNFLKLDFPKGSITADMLSDGVLKSVDLFKDAIKSENIKDGEVKEGDLADGAVTSGKISDNTITATDLNATLTFAALDYLDLSAITHNTTAHQGLRLPNATSASPSSLTSGEGYIAWDTAGDQLIVYNGSSWATVAGGGGSSKWTDAGTFTYLTATADDLVLGDSTVSAASFFFDESAGQLYLGTDNTLSGAITLYAGAAATTDATISTNTSGDLILNAGGVLDIDDPTISLATQATDLDIINTSTTALTISEAANNYLVIDTSGEIITLDTPITSGTLNLGTSNVARTINIGTGTAADTINIGTGATTANTIAIGTGTVANTITIGSSTSSLALTEDTWSLTAAGVLSGLTGLTVSSGTVSLPAGQIDNTELANSSLTVTAGTGLSGGGLVSLGGSTSLSVDQSFAPTWTGAHTFSGNITADDSSADTILIGQAGVTDDTVTIAGDLSLTDDQWSISALGVVSGLTGTLTGLTAGIAQDLVCTNCIGGVEIDESLLSVPFSTVTGGTSTGALVVGTGGSLTTSGTGTITATDLVASSGVVSNAELANSSVTITAGTGLSGGGAVSLG
ncbi:hypothetical protein HY419_00275, partial [candidate division WWE3 bacterium]|nr:hypothetical protein [candidate division WWE3 bacterium]